MPALPAHVITRAVPDAFDQALQHRPAPIDVSAARAQHAGYVAALRRAGASVTVLPAQHHLPDCCFVEDPVVVLGERALLCRSAAASRGPEADTLRPALSARCDLVEMAAPATLDGGDVMRVQDRLFVGRSSRTNAAGVDALRAAGGLEVVEVPLRDGLHLKSVVTLAAPGTLLCVAGAIDVEAFSGLTLLEAPEWFGGNVLRVGAVTLVSAAAPQTAALLRARGVAVDVVDVGEFHKADGALTCLSVRLPPPGGWVA